MTATTHTHTGTPRTWAVPGTQLSAAQAAALTLIIVLTLLTAGVIGFAAAGPRPPVDDSAEAGFVRDMQAHHDQAIQMAMIIRDGTSEPTIRTMAYDIALGQQQQAGQMFGWLTQWGLPQTGSRPRMAWMTTHDTDAMSGMSGMDGSSPETSPTPSTAAPLPDGRMPGMATQADLATLAALKGRPAEVSWLRLMIVHHRGGVAMAQAILGRTDRPEVRTLARNIANAQQAEIIQMTRLLQERGESAP